MDPDEQPIPKARNPRKTPWRNEPAGLREELYRIFGVDLTQVPGISSLTTQMLLSEIGTDLSRFCNAAAFTSWLGLCPSNEVSGGKILSTKTRKVKNRAGLALRMAAQSLHRSQSFLGEYFRRMRARLGAPKAITATPTSWRASSTICSPAVGPTTRASFSSTNSDSGNANRFDFVRLLVNLASNSSLSKLFLRRARFRFTNRELVCTKGPPPASKNQRTVNRV